MLHHARRAGPTPGVYSPRFSSICHVLFRCSCCSDCLFYVWIRTTTRRPGPLPWLGLQQKTALRWAARSPPRRRAPSVAGCMRAALQRLMAALQHQPAALPPCLMAAVLPRTAALQAAVPRLTVPRVAPPVRLHLRPPQRLSATAMHQQQCCLWQILQKVQTALQMLRSRQLLPRRS